MDGNLIGILLGPGLALLAGLFLLYLGFLSPVFRRSSEQIVPDSWVGVYRALTRIAGVLLSIVAVIRGIEDFRHRDRSEAVDWQEVTSVEGRFRIASPAEFSKDVKSVPYGEWRVSEHCFRVEIPKVGFFVSYIDLPPEALKIEAAALLQQELDGHIRASGLRPMGTEAVSFSGCPALRYKLHNVPKGFFVEGILFLAGGRRYQLAVQFTGESSLPIREHFFESFRIIEDL